MQEYKMVKQPEDMNIKLFPHQLKSIYDMEKSLPLEYYIQAIIDTKNRFECFRDINLWCEPGRGLVAESEGFLTRIDGIKNNIEENMKLILLNTDYMPIEIVDKMEQVYERFKA